MEIRKVIEEQLSRSAYMGHPALLDRYILRKGHEGKPQRRPKGVRKQPDQACFGNSIRHCLRRPGLFYVEGYALNNDIGILIHHAWVEDGDHNVIDLTWRDPHRCQYFGVPFEPDAAMEEMRKQGVYGLLMQYDMYNAEFMYAQDPGLQQEVEAIIEQRRKKQTPMDLAIAAASK